MKTLENVLEEIKEITETHKLLRKNDSRITNIDWEIIDVPINVVKEFMEIPENKTRNTIEFAERLGVQIYEWDISMQIYLKSVKVKRTTPKIELSEYEEI